VEKSRSRNTEARRSQRGASSYFSLCSLCLCVLILTFPATSLIEGEQSACANQAGRFGDGGEGGQDDGLLDATKESGADDLAAVVGGSGFDDRPSRILRIEQQIQIQICPTPFEGRILGEQNLKSSQPDTSVRDCFAGPLLTLRVVIKTLIQEILLKQQAACSRSRLMRCQLPSASGSIWFVCPNVVVNCPFLGWQIKSAIRQGI
jgi:hypothetical protein